MAAEPVYDLLPNRILNLLTQDRKLAYAQVAPDLTISAFSDNLRESLSERGSLSAPDQPEGMAGRYLGDVFWEFVSAERALAAILNGTLPEYRIENANREEPDGTIRYFTLRVVPLDESKPGDGLLLTVEDNTAIGTLEQMLVQERNALRLAQARLARANAELTRLNHLKSLFLSIAAHDLRAPLAAIRGYADLVKSGISGDTGDAAENQESLTIIISQVDHLDRLIADLLDLEMIEQGKLLVRPVICDLTSLVRKVFEALLLAAADQGLEMHMQDPGAAIIVLADPGRLQQIIYNLIGNALKYTPTGGRIQVSCRPEERYGVFQVTDNGRGIAPDEMPHVFEIYHRTEEAMQSQVRGTGLGLYIVKSLVDELGGKISVSSKPVKGTTFTVHIPRPNVPQSGEMDAGESNTGRR